MNNIDANKEFEEILYRLKHIIGSVPKHMEECIAFLCYCSDHSEYNGDFIEDFVNNLVVRYHNEFKPKFNWNL